MPWFVDIHCHALFGVDDGAENEQEMQEMLRMAYEDGTRTLCLTPHYDPEFKEKKSITAEQAFALAEAYCQQHFPDLKLILGNEMSYLVGCTESLLNGECRTVAGGRYVLVDFFMTPTLSEIRRGLSVILGCGYLPIVAHTERYPCLHGKIREIAEFVENGALIQLNAASLSEGLLSPVGRTARQLLSEGLVHVVASDGHNALSRPPILSKAYGKVLKKYGQACADTLFFVNPSLILAGERIR